jgi:hypothetical protein
MDSGSDGESADAGARDGEVSDGGDPKPRVECPQSKAFEPLDDGCPDAVCHVVLRLDYQTLELRGWTAVGGPRSDVDTDAARMIAKTAIENGRPHGQYVRPTEPRIDGPQAGLYLVYASPADFGAFALIGEKSGAVVAGGSVLWSGPGRYWDSWQWKSHSDLVCGASVAEPSETFVGRSECDGLLHDSTAPAASDALETALRTNLAANVAAKGAFSAYVYLYTPSVGVCRPMLAEYLVVLTQLRE